MKKNYILILMVMFVTFSLNAQQTIFTDNFDSYVTGQGVALQAGDPWTTWSELPGGAEDPLVSDIQSNSPSNSVYVSSGNDCVLLLGDSTSGRYKFSFYIYVESGNLGYYNLLSNFDGADSEWGMQAFFDAGGQGSIDAGGNGTGTFSYSYDSWFLIENFVDLDNDWAEVFIDGNYIVGWQWSLGSFGGGSEMKVSASNFYGWDGSKSINGTPGFYFDDVDYSLMPIGESPQNLESTVDGVDVSLSWEAPASDSPFTYYVFRGNELVAITPDLYFDESLDYPGTYTYKVKAFYLDMGLSNPSNSSVVMIEGGLERENILLEIGTGTWCTYCPGAAMGADDLIEEDYDVAVIEYHYGDSYETTQSLARNNYYSITGYPTSVFDGISSHEGGSHSESLFPTYVTYYENRINDQSIFGLDMDVVLTTSNTFEVTLNTEQLWDYTAGDLRLHLVLTESHIPENWQGQTEVSFVFREMYPGSDGTELTLENNGDTQEETFTVEVSNSFDVMECELVAFIQDNSTKEVMNSVKVSLGQIVGVEEQGESYTKIFPNPTNGSVSIESASHIKNISIYNLSGQKVSEFAMDQQSVKLNLESLNKGIYMIEIITEHGKRIEKLNIN